MPRHPASPSKFPAPWASSWGEDACGPWLSLSLNGIRQIFRWIRPGRFLMGSPKEEAVGLFLPGRETQHEATLSKGFWLAETTVTQELWLAAMKSNPSGFIGFSLPVERISWNDAQLFIRRLNVLIPGLEARLPTEAEWEHACRAGSTTPFSFGKDILPEQANFSRPAQGNGRLHRRRTMIVKSLPCNAWGLHEMHGNVWEWCQDFWQDDLGADPVVDPQGPRRGELRAVRGGSWACDARFIRSACRNRHYPDYDEGSIGLRLAASDI